MLAAETYWGLVTNVPHILFELTWEVITAIAFIPVGKWLQRRHDRKVHGTFPQSSHDPHRALVERLREQSTRR